MFSKTALEEYLQQENPYPCLNLLESAMVCYKWTEDKIIPAPLLDDLYYIFGENIVETTAENLITIKVLARTDHGLLLNHRALMSTSSLLNELKNDLRLPLAEKNETAREFLARFVEYLKRNASDLVISETTNDLEFVLVWQDKEYRLQLAFSPVWLPVIAEKVAAEKSYIALFGPFMALDWEVMFKYYAYTDFRDHTAYFDPWHLQKMNISRGELFTYFDWFLRDIYGVKSFIPQPFSLALQNMGLLRYNDER
jgi:hypothetical protein